MGDARGRASRSDTATSVEGSRTPLPPPELHVTWFDLPCGSVFHRVHLNLYQACQFNPGKAGNARFSPIMDVDGQPIPTLYGGSTTDCALMETVFHDVPYTPGFKFFDKGKLAGQVHSIIEVIESLRLIDLASVPLRKLGVTRKQLIDTEKDQYSQTRAWAEAIYRQCPTAQGLSWVSRQNDAARALMLFGNRIPSGAIRQQARSRGLLEDDSAYDAVLELAEQIGVNVIAGRF